MTMMDSSNIVVEWLHFLQLGHYARDFVENGYDDLETVKRIGPPDLDAIGVVSVHHRSFLLDAVRVLREQGAAWVYLLLGTAAGPSPASSCRSSSPRTPEQSCATETTDCQSEGSLHSVILHRPSPINPLQLRSLVRDKLRSDDIRLSSSPYTSQSGDGYLANLASRYSSELGLSYPLVLQQLEDLRLAEWSDRAPPPPTVPTPGSSSESRRHIPFPNDYVNYPASDCGLPTTGSRCREGNYVPGSYSPSSCLSERDGDQIYDYASKYRSQIRAQQAKMLMSPHSWLQMARRIISKAGNQGHNRGLLQSHPHYHHHHHHPHCRNRLSSADHNLRFQSQSEGNLSQLGNANMIYGPDGLLRCSGVSNASDPHRHHHPSFEKCESSGVGNNGGVTVFKTKVMYHHGSEQELGGSGINVNNNNN
ncbi:uncharacterized protein [Lepeophtheirus salmonis]|nr:uncharacterized protein LOC121118282 [Lepeophtheirus salmonis]